MDPAEFLVKAGQSRGGGIRSDIKLKFGQIPRVGNLSRILAHPGFCKDRDGSPRLGLSQKEDLLRGASLKFWYKRVFVKARLLSRCRTGHYPLVPYQAVPILPLQAAVILIFSVTGWFYQRQIFISTEPYSMSSFV